MKNIEEYNYAYPRPALTVDAIVFTFSDNEIKMLLVKRAQEPYKNKWVFPGGFVNENETVEAAMERELMEETSLSVPKLEQMYTASAPGRDPRGWTVSTVFVSFVNWENARVRAGDDAGEAEWTPINSKPELAFDHEELFKRGMHYLKNLVRFFIVPRELFPAVFRPEQIHDFILQLTGSKEEADRLAQRLIKTGAIVPSNDSGLFSFNDEKYSHILKFGFAGE